MANVKHSSSGFERDSRDRRRADSSKDVRHTESKRDREAEGRDN